MPEFNSLHFGVVTYAEESVIEFPLGLPGFENENRFVPIEQPVNKPLVFLQSLDRPEVCFPTLPMQAVFPDYQLSLSAEDLSVLGFAGDRQPAAGRDVLCLTIIALAEDRPPAVNLLSPVVVNWENRRAVQSIQADSGYSHEQPLFDLMTAPVCS